tara:strand:+ start:372 stop:632 length:261 start_codon:yes stop_codon:yes gene_type:complete
VIQSHGEISLNAVDYLMKHFLFGTFFASLLISTAAKAERDEIKHICASMQVGDLTAKQALRKIGLKVPKGNQRTKAVAYCKVYIGY